MSTLTVLGYLLLGAWALSIIWMAVLIWRAPVRNDLDPDRLGQVQRAADPSNVVRFPAQLRAVPDATDTVGPRTVVTLWPAGGDRHGGGTA